MANNGKQSNGVDSQSFAADKPATAEQGAVQTALVSKATSTNKTHLGKTLPTGQQTWVGRQQQTGPLVEHCMRFGYRCYALTATDARLLLINKRPPVLELLLLVVYVVPATHAAVAVC